MAEHTIKNHHNPQYHSSYSSPAKKKCLINLMRSDKSTNHFFLTALFLLFILAGLPGTSISAGETAGKEVNQKKTPYANAEIIIKIIPAANNTFGYEILLSGRPLVHQLSIPALPGNDGFTTKGDAQKVAEFVVKKIRNNEMPPTVTIEDLNNMGVLKKD